MTPVTSQTPWVRATSPSLAVAVARNLDALAGEHRERRLRARVGPAGQVLRPGGGRVRGDEGLRKDDELGSFSGSLGGQRAEPVDRPLAIEDDRLGLDAGDRDGALHSGRVAPCGDYPGGMTTIFVDFDGTITEQDLLDRIAQTFGDPAVYREVDEALDEGRITLNEVLGESSSRFGPPLDDVVAWVLEHASVRPGLPRARRAARRARLARGHRLERLPRADRARARSVRASAGVELLSNRVEPDPAGWRVPFRVTDDCPSAGSPASARRWSPRPTATCACTSATASPTAAAPRPATWCSPAAASRPTSSEEGVAFEAFDDFFRVADGIDEALARR